MDRIRRWRPGKHKPMDMSRFSGCSIKPVILADLLSDQEFENAVRTCKTPITNEWVFRKVIDLYSDTAISPDDGEKMLQSGSADEYVKIRSRHAFFSEIRRKLCKQFPECASLYAEIKKGEMEKALHDE